MLNYALTLLSAILLVTDRITKLIFREYLLINNGSFYGLIPNSNTILIIFSIITILLLALIITKSNRALVKAGAFFVITGIFANLIDRI